MKKIILVCFTFLGLHFVNAQEPSGLSIMTGVNLPYFKTNAFNVSSQDPGLMLGLGFNSGYHETYNYQFEVLYFENKINLVNSQGNSDSFLMGGSIQTGLYLNYFIIKPEEDRFYFGPQIGVNALFGKTLTKSNVYTPEPYLPSGLSSLKLNESSLFNYGAGFGLTGAFNKFRFNLRYNLGLSNLFRDISKSVPEGSSASSDRPFTGELSSISFSISYRILSKI